MSFLSAWRSHYSLYASTFFQIITLTCQNWSWMLINPSKISYTFENVTIVWFPDASEFTFLIRNMFKCGFQNIKVSLRSKWSIQYFWWHKSLTRFCRKKSWSIRVIFWTFIMFSKYKITLKNRVFEDGMCCNYCVKTYPIWQCHVHVASAMAASR